MQGYKCYYVVPCNKTSVTRILFPILLGYQDEFMRLVCASIQLVLAVKPRLPTNPKCGSILERKCSGESTKCMGGALRTLEVNGHSRR